MKEKLKCKICGLLFEKIRSISNHVCKKHKIILRDYYDKFFKVNKNEGLCKICRKPTTFYSLRFGYATYCCPKCGYGDEEAKKERNSLIKISHNKPESIEKNRNITLNLWKNEKFRQNAMDKNVEAKKKMVKTKKNKMKEDDHYLDNIRESNKNPEKRLKSSKSMKKRWKDLEYRSLVIKNIKLALNKPEVRENRCNKIKEGWAPRPGGPREKTSLRMKKKWKDEKYRKEMIEILKEYNNRPEVKERMSEQLKNGQAVQMNKHIKNPSRPQKLLFDIVKTIFSTAIINYPLARGLGESDYSLDIAIPQIKLVIEYDGSYWHKDKKRDNQRQTDIENLGWEVIRYIDVVPTKDQIIKDMNKFLFLNN